MSEVAMWLLPVTISCLVGIFIGLRNGLAWSWGLCLQQLIILSIALAGFACLYAPLGVRHSFNGERAAAVFTVLAWLFFIFFNLGQRWILDLYSLDLALFKVRQAQAKTGLVRLFVWGPPGRLWQDIALSLAYFNEQRQQEAMAIIENWRHDNRLPQNARENLIGFSMLGRVLVADWQGIVNEFEEFRGQFGGTGTAVPYQMAARAYAELGRFSESVACLNVASVPNMRSNALTLQINFMTFFGLSGAVDQLVSLLQSVPDKQALPEYVRLYWLARCFAVRGWRERAIAKFNESLQLVPPQMEIWRRRIEVQLARQAMILEGAGETVESSGAAAAPDIVAEAGRIYRKAKLAIELVNPAKMKAGVLTIIVITTFAYVVSNADQFLGANEYTIFVRRFCYLAGALDWTGLLKGQWWRLLSYLLLHGNSAHLLLNIGALYLFGKPVENMFGSARFFLIYLLSGIFSGLAQVWLMPQDAAIGASGAIFGVFGAAIAGIVRLKAVLPADLRRSQLRWMVSIALAQAIFDQFTNTIVAATDKTGQAARIAAFAHMGGILSGFVLGMLLPLRNFTDRLDEGEFGSASSLGRSDLLK